jgi:hypothetical protein
MAIFQPDSHSRSPRHRRLYAVYEILFTVADFAAAFLFIIGSVLFFDEDTAYAGTWMFLVGSVFFALKPSIRVARELHFWRIGAYDRLAERAEDP